MKYVVPDCFEDFANNEEVVCAGSLAERLAAGGSVEQEEFVLYPGLDEQTQRELVELVSRRALTANVLVDGGRSPRVANGLVHKRSPHNVCVSVPVRSSDGRWRSRLLVDGQNSEMSDHVTGQHVPGMVLIEAARQAMMTVVETTAFEPEVRGTTGYVLQRVDVHFESYAFPLDVEIVTELQKCERESSGVLRLGLQVEFFQHASRVCFVGCDATGYPLGLLRRLETRAARAALKRSMGNVRHSCETDTAPQAGGIRS